MSNEPKLKATGNPEALGFGYLPKFRIPPHAERPVYVSPIPAPDSPPKKKKGTTLKAPKPPKAPLITTPAPPKMTVVEHHDIGFFCEVRREHIKGDTHLTFSCSTHEVRWQVPRCNVLSDDGYRCLQPSLPDLAACKFHSHTRLICNDCGHNVHWKDDDPNSTPLHHEDHRFKPNDDGRFCADCNMPGRMSRDGHIKHRWDHTPQVIEWPWETDPDEVASPLPV